MTEPAPSTAVRTRAPGAEATPPRPRAHGPRARRDALTARAGIAMYILPALALVGILLLVPFGYTVYQSLTEYDGISPAEFVGFDNYVTLLGAERFHRSLINTVIWTVGTLLLPVLLGLLIAVLTNASGWPVWVRYAFVLPYAISGTATGVIWGFMLRSDGAVNQVLGAFGLDSLQQEWLLSWPMNTIVMILAETWRAVGISIILFLVGLQTVPRETVEAGMLDGASGFRLFRRIVFPQLRAVTVVVVGISIANSLRVFDVIWLLTQGGPGWLSETLAVTMYRQTFVLSEYGLGSAVAVVLAVIVVSVSWIYLRQQMPKRG
ncbi:carbohydrate ABC transporter permease [Haloactinopolyspora alba]|uniref:carbohydrate ABC transporter permease n=1 Tax=Haloactinopolyspora alba TaxID=648780 RepID=UPI00197AD790|nr:sugar ABC transporter permease [Haloactinopolyspora alba]